MPIDSLYQATKFSIQQGIIDMQEKLRRKNQLQLQRQLTESLLQQQHLYRQERQLQQLQRVYNNNAKYTNAVLQRTTCDPYVNSIVYDSGLNDPAGLEYYQLKEAIRKQAQHLEYLKRLQRMKAQSLALNNPITSGITRPIYQDPRLNHGSPIRQFSSNKASLQQSRNYSSKKSPIKTGQAYRNLQYNQEIDQDSSALLQKYNKGIRAQQYNRDMQRLIEIEKRLRKMEQQSGSKSAYGAANESLVTAYKPKYEESLLTARGQQNIPIVSARQNIHEAQRPIKIQEDEEFKRPLVQTQATKKVQMFQNQKIGKEINKRHEDKNEMRPSFNKNQHTGLERIDKLIKNTQGKHQLSKPYEYGRPSSSRPRNSTKRSVSKSNRSALSPLKSQRTLNKKQFYEPYTKSRRPRAKSTKQQKISKNKYQPYNPKQINSRLISLDPTTERFYQQIIRKQVNQKIQNRLKLLTCVFKDVNMRKDKNQIQALLQRFEIETRGRKQIKSMINNDPKILKKHKLVVG